MNAKERKQEEKELEQAVRTLRSAIRAIAHRKAQRYEQEFLFRVRDMISEEIKTDAEVKRSSASYLGKSVELRIIE